MAESVELVLHNLGESELAEMQAQFKNIWRPVVRGMSAGPLAKCCRMF